jgi:hypothetical protein
MHKNLNNSTLVKCLYCDNEFLKFNSEIKRTTSNFCTRSCRTTYFRRQQLKDYKTYTEVKCLRCDKVFNKLTGQVKEYPRHFCSRKCCSVYTLKERHGHDPRGPEKIKSNCAYCNKDIFRKPSNNNERNFCSGPCYHNYCQKNDLGRSKAEICIEKLLRKNYPDLNILFNNRNILSGLELDILIPKLDIAFEINGICHYKPIYGEKSFNRTTESDKRKQILCNENNIELHIIDISHRYCGKQYKILEFYDQIKSIIDKRIKCLHLASMQ